MAELTATLDKIERKMQLLIARLTQVEHDKATLSAENKQLIDENRSLQAHKLLDKSEISHLKSQLAAQEAFYTEGATAKKHHIRKEIDQYIAEVDRCIEWLQKT